MKLTIDYATMNRIAEVIRPLCGEHYVSFAFGTGKIPGSNEVPDAMVSKISIATGTDQAEVGVVTGMPEEEIPKPFEKYGLENPLEKVVLKSSEFIAVVDALSAYEHSFTVVTDAAKVMFSVGDATMPVYRADPSQMKALVPHRQNSSQYERFDRDILTIRFIGRELLGAIKTATALERKIDSETFKYCEVSVRDMEVVSQQIERGGEMVTVPKYNAKVQFLNTNRFAFASGVTNAFVHKGAGNDLISCIQDKSRLDGLKNPVFSFEKDGDDIKPVVTSYVDYKKGYDAKRGLHCEETEFLFAVPLDAVNKLARLVSVVPDTYVDVTVGEKYVYVMFNGLQCIYMAAQRPVEKISLVKTYCVQCEQIAKKDSSLVIDTRALVSSMKLAQIYDRDKLFSRMPLELLIEKKGITVRKGESESLIRAVSADTELDAVTYGIDASYIPCITNGLPAGSIRLGYGVDAPLMAFTQGDKELSADNNAMIVAGIANVRETVSQIQDAYLNEKNEAAKK